MNEKLISEDKYTDKIKEAIFNIKYRAFKYLGINLADKDVIVSDVEGTLFVIGNPIIPRVVDTSLGLVMENIRNITIECDDRKLVREDMSMTFSFVPHLIVSCPFLLARIQNNNEIVYGGHDTNLRFDK